VTVAKRITVKHFSRVLGSCQLTDNRKKVSTNSDSTVLSEVKMEKDSGIYEIILHCSEYSGFNAADAIGVAFPEIPGPGWRETPFYLAWKIDGMVSGSYSSPKCVLKYADFGNSQIRGDGQLPRVTTGDTVGLIYDSHKQTLHFKKNGELQPVWISDVPTGVYFFVGRWNYSIEFSIR
jgi:hypothetical protein